MKPEQEMSPTTMSAHPPGGGIEPRVDTLELHGITLSRSWIAECCRRHRVRPFALFGSILRDDFWPESDLDVLVEFEPGRTPGLAFFGMQEELSERFGRPVDLNTPGFLSRYFRDRVQAEALSLYDTERSGSAPAHA
jgi:predicted nucleotidyltransferase